MSTNLIDAVFNTLAADSEFMWLLGLTPASTDDEITSRLIRGTEADRPVTTETAPQVTIYTNPGRFGRNHLVFEGKFCMDFYGRTRYQAVQLFERSFKLFHDKDIVSNGFHSYRCVLAYDGDFATGIAGVKGYKAIFDVDYLRVN